MFWIVFIYSQFCTTWNFDVSALISEDKRKTKDTTEKVDPVKEESTPTNQEQVKTNEKPTISDSTPSTIKEEDMEVEDFKTFGNNVIIIFKEK